MGPVPSRCPSSKSGRKILKPKRWLNAAILGSLSFQLGAPISAETDYLQSSLILNTQMKCNHIINKFPYSTCNNYHPLTCATSQANTNILHYNQAMKADDANFFKEARDVEIKGFKEENMFALIQMHSKPEDKSLIPFVWSFKRKRNALGEPIKYEARLHINGAKQVFDADNWNTHAPVVKSSTIRIMLMLHKINE